MILRDRKGTLFTSTLKTNYYGDDKIFTEDDGFQIAIGIGDNRNFTSFADPFGRDVSEFIEIVVTQVSVNALAENITEIFSLEVLDLHKCTEEELGLDESGNSKFYPIIEELQDSLANLKEIFYCFDHSSVQIMNDRD